MIGRLSVARVHVIGARPVTIIVIAHIAPSLLEANHGHKIATVTEPGTDDHNRTNTTPAETCDAAEAGHLTCHLAAGAITGLLHPPQPPCQTPASLTPVLQTHRAARPHDTVIVATADNTGGTESSNGLMENHPSCLVRHHHPVALYKEYGRVSMLILIFFPQRMT